MNKYYWWTMLKGKILNIVILGASLAILLAGCGEKREVKKVSLSEKMERVAPEIPKGALRVAIAAMVSPQESLVYYQELLDHLSQNLEKPIVLKQRRTYREIIDLLKAGQLDLAFVCSGTYVVAKEETEVELLVVPVVKGRSQYFSYLIVPRDSKISRLEDLEGKTFAFTDSLSTSGRVFPVYILARENHHPQTFFSKTIFTHSHDNSIKAVAEGLVEGAAVDSLVWDYLSVTRPEVTSKTRIILKSPPYAMPPVVVPKGLDSKLTEKIRQVFLGLPKEERGRRILEKIMVDRFIVENDSRYDSLRRMRVWLKEKGL